MRDEAVKPVSNEFNLQPFIDEVKEQIKDEIREYFEKLKEEHETKEK